MYLCLVSYFPDRIFLIEVFTAKIYVFQQCLLTICFDLILIQFLSYIFNICYRDFC